tara:strand:- start:171 stop:1148 length:978 start_codon:yes stop_codon:yes gene_type:complete
MFTKKKRKELHDKTILSKKFGEFKMIPIFELEIETDYQRQIKPKHVEVISKSFDWAAFGTLIVHQRQYTNDNKYYVLDGQQRMEAVAILYGRDFPVPCINIKFSSDIVSDHTTEIVAESFIFNKINVGRKNLTTLEKFFPRKNAQELTGKGVSIGVWNISNECGFVIPRYATKDQGYNKNNKVTAIATIETIHERKPEGQLYRETLEYVGKHWSKMAFNTRSETLYGISNFLFSYSDTPFLTTERMDKTMSNYSPAETGELSTEKYDSAGKRGDQKGAGLSFAKAFYDFYVKSIRKTDEREEEMKNFGKHWLEMSAKELRTIKGG